MSKGLSVRRRQLLAQMTGRGHRFEEQLFGFSAKDVPRPPPSPYLECLRECLLRQPTCWNPYKPPTELARRLRYCVAKHFTKGQQKRVGLYVALGTPLDFWHGTDCFFYYAHRLKTQVGPPVDEDWSSGQWRVTIDVASYDKERQTPGREVTADVLITPETFEFGDLKNVGRCIADYLKGKITLWELKTRPYVWATSTQVVTS